MTEYSKFNIIYRLQKWMDSVPGQTFLNYAYSWGAAVVILGTLFKLTHLPGANFWLFLGMGTEVVVFFLSAFDRPFDKTADGRELPTHLGVSADGEGEGVVADVQEGLHVSAGPSVSGGVQGGGTIIIGGGGSGSGSGYAEGGLSTGTSGDDDLQVAAVAQPVGGGGGTTTWVAQQQETTPEMIEAQGNYVDNLNKLNETLAKVEEQSQRLTRDSEEMENLNRTLTGISKVYEMQLKGASAQIGTIDEINEQTRKLAKQIAELNKIYARMIEAMTVNMPKAPMPTVNNEDL
ncbi:MAG: gliding motility protein GldL [Prevotella sp.]|nr:gliding motility protein GldL [Prevotella sp.]